MQKIIARLKLDHQRLAKVLQELEAVANDTDRGTVGSDQLFCLLDYLAEYPHQIHHPTEDLIFGEMLKKTLTTEQQQIVEGNARQHNELEQNTAELLECIDDVDFSDNETLHEYVTLQRKHMGYEESVVFPMATELFSAADWQRVAGHQEQLHDPLFDAAEHRFATLFECLGVEPDKMRARGADAVTRFLGATRG